MRLINIAPARSSGRGRLAAALNITQLVIVQAFVAALLVPTMAIAQTNPYSDSSIPYGSPVGGQSSAAGARNSGDENAGSSGTQTPTYSRIEPVTVEGSNRTMAGQDQRLQIEDNAANPRAKPAKPGEFERYVERTLGRLLPRFGADLLLPSNRDYAVPATTTPPPDYILNVGDKITISLIGSVEGSLEREIDTNGRIFLPKVGAIILAGVRYADLKSVVSAAIGRQYRGYNVTVSITELRGVRVYVTGFANNPGAYSVNSLSTMVNAVLAAGGPSSGGSFRSVLLYRNGQLVSDFDLYDLIRKGDRRGDAILQNEDVLFIPPVGDQVAITGSVNAEAIYEAKRGESIETLMSYAGGANALADKSRIMLYRLSKLDTVIGQEISSAELAARPVEGGDIIQVLSQGTLQRPVDRQAVLVRIEGEVEAPGNYYVSPNTPLADVMAKAGGLTSRAFVYGTRVERLSVQRQQRESFREAIDQLEISLAASPLSADQSIDAGSRAAQVAAARAVLDRLRQAEPDGRVVLDVTPGATSLPGNFLLENNDHIVIPPTPTTVGVFGAVYRPASFLIGSGGTGRVRSYLDRAGGALRSADKGEIFVVRANGDVLTRRKGALDAQALPGDVVFVPVKTQQSSVWAKIREISTIVFQLGITAAAIASIN
jgi:protein involved in polysaccharide export with SLBB domain